MCIVMATTAVAATTRAQGRSRRAESGVLRALGLFSREQAAVRFRELAMVILAAALAGAVVGLAVSALTVPQLARAAIPAPYLAVGTELAVDAAPLAAAILTLLAALAVVALVARWRTGALARGALPTEGLS
jgi:ABC-type antimicrobial peptide transport system permease subunit